MIKTNSHLSIIRSLATRINNSDMSFQELSHKSGVDRSVIHRWLYERVSPRTDNLEAVLNTVGLTMIAHPLEGG
jgi:DNA-binding phage protein